MISLEVSSFSAKAGLVATISIVGEVNGIPATLSSAGPGLLRVIATQPFPPGTRVWLTVRNARAVGTVFTCAAIGAEFSIAVHIGNGGDPRREPRLPLHWPALLFTFDEVVKDLAVDVLDISAHGLGIRSPVRIHAGTALALELPLGLVFGEARYSKRLLSDGSFRVGILLHDVLAYEQTREFISSDDPWYHRLLKRGKK